MYNRAVDDRAAEATVIRMIRYGSIVERLAEVGILVPAPDDPNVPTGAAADQLEQDVIAWLETIQEPLGLSEAVLEDRR